MATEEKVAEPTSEDVKMSKEKIAKRRAEVTKYYKEQIPHLKTQLQYEELMTNIEEQRVKRLQAQAFLAQAYGQTEESEEDSSDGKRTLKRN
jgi:hypothetical protein